MSNAKFTSNRNEFHRMHNALIDYLQQSLVMNIEVIIKIGGKTPVDTGRLKSEVRHFRSPKGGWRIEADTDYAAYQERGMTADGKKIVRNYTTAGTGKGWFQDAIDRTYERQDNFIAEARRAFGL